MINITRCTLLSAALLLVSGFSCAESLPPGTAPQTISLAATPDPGLVGKKVNVIARRLSNFSADGFTETLILQGVLLMSTNDKELAVSDLQATLALSPKEAKKLSKLTNKVGIDFLIKGR